MEGGGGVGGSSELTWNVRFMQQVQDVQSPAKSRGA